MPLRWDPLLVRHLAGELHERLAGARLRAVRLDGASRTLVLLFRESTLVWHLHPSRGAPELHAAVAPDLTDLPLASRLRLVRSVADERLVVLELLPTRGRGRRDISVELLGNQWNAVVTDGPEGRIRHILVRREKPRLLRPGAVYDPPPAPGREGADGLLTLDRWTELLATVPPSDRAKELVRRVAWTSPIVASALVDGHPDPATALTEGHALWASLVSGARSPDPTLLDTPRGRQPYPFSIPGIPGEPATSLLDAFAEVAAESRHGENQGAAVALPPGLVQDLESALDVALRRSTRLEAELAGLPVPEALRAQGDLILARFSDIQAGSPEAELVDFEGRPVRLELDPGLAVHENAAALYDRAAKADRALHRLPEAIEEARSRARVLEGLLARVRSGDAGAEDIREALPTAGSARPQPGPGPALPYRVYRSSGGLEIRVGRGAKSNDDLTFRHASPEDVWLHARHAAGAHVVLRWAGPGNPPARDLEEAAVLAALHSKARTSGSVPVDWTLRKYVRKPRGARPGSVAPDRVKTLFVTPDPAVASRLEER